MSTGLPFKPGRDIFRQHLAFSSSAFAGASLLKVRSILCVKLTLGRRAVGTLNDTPVEFKVELKEPEPKPFPSVPVGAGTFNLERSTLVSRTRPRRR